MLKKSYQQINEPKKNIRMIEQTDIEIVIQDFKERTKPDDRYTSFDYCYNYFRTTKDLNIDLEKSCLVLGFYLASWGMFRGSSFLLQHSVSHFKPTIQYINSLDKSIWDIDVDRYDKNNIELITNIYKEIKERLIPNDNTDLTLITKVLLGVFGFIPAFDSYFCDTFRLIFDGECGFRRVNEVSLNLISNFYQANKDSIDNLSNNTFTTDFLTGKKTMIKYPKAKIIDMYGFNKSNIMITEKVFEILGEGGGICIKRQINKSEEKFLYDHNEYDFTDEGLDVNEKGIYLSFDKAFQLINDRYSWFMLDIETIHNDYRNYVIEKLIEKLNEKSIDLDYLNNSKLRLEQSFNIELNCKQSNGKPIWSFTNR
jgi:hypothetical protein